MKRQFTISIEDDICDALKKVLVDLRKDKKDETFSRNATIEQLLRESPRIQNYLKK